MSLWDYKVVMGLEHRKIKELNILMKDKLRMAISNCLVPNHPKILSPASRRHGRKVNAKRSHFLFPLNPDLDNPYEPLLKIEK